MTSSFEPDELGLATPPPERVALAAVARRLEADRPVPSAAFRGELRRRLIGQPRGHARPARLRLQLAAYACSGLVLLLFAASSVAGLGPLAA